MYINKLSVIPKKFKIIKILLINNSKIYKITIIDIIMSMSFVQQKLLSKNLFNYFFQN